MKKLLFIYNPASGKGKVRSRLAEVVECFSAEGWQVSVYPTQAKADATRAVRELGADFDRVVCAGGDGTLSETVAGLVYLPRPPVLGYIPNGSTNDCAYNLHLPADPAKAAAIAAGQGEIASLDVGRFNDKPFVYVAAFGAFTTVAYDTPQNLKKTFGHMAYIAAGIGQLTNLTPYRLRVEWDGNTVEDEFLYGMVCNSYSVAGVRAVAGPRVALDDGRFEVLLVRKSMKLTDLAAIIQALMRKQPIETSAVLSFETDRVTFTSRTEIPWTIDGERGGAHRVCQVNNQPCALRVVRGNH